MKRIALIILFLIFGLIVAAQSLRPLSVANTLRGTNGLLSIRPSTNQTTLVLGEETAGDTAARIATHGASWGSTNNTDIFDAIGGGQWKVIEMSSAAATNIIPVPPSDGNVYAVSNGMWVTFTVGSGGSAVSVDDSLQSSVNFADSAELGVTKSGADATYAIVANSVGTNKLTVAAYQGLKEYTTLLNFPTIIQRLNNISGSQGDLLYRDGTGWTNFGKGTQGQALFATGTGLAYSNMPAGGGTGYLPLTAGYGYQLTGPLAMLQAATATQIILGNTADIANGNKHVALQSSDGKFQVVDIQTNSPYAVGQTLFNIDSTTDSATNVYYFGTPSGKQDWMYFQSERFMIPTGTLEVGGSNVMALLAESNWPEKKPVFFDDMIYVSAPTLTGGGPAGATSNGTGAGASVIASESGEHGILQMSTGTNATGNNRYQVGLSATAILLGGAAWEWEARVKMPTLSSATERYFVRAGFYDVTATNAVDGAYLEYVHDANSGNWVAKNYSNSTATTGNCSVGPVANTWTTLKGVIDSGASACSYYVDGTLATTVSGGLPTGAGRETRFAIIIEASGGSTGIGADTMQIGYVKVTPTYATAR